MTGLTRSWLLSVTRSKIANRVGRRARQPAAVNLVVGDSSGTDRMERYSHHEVISWEQAWDAEWQRNLTDAVKVVYWGREGKIKVGKNKFIAVDSFQFNVYAPPGESPTVFLGLSVGDLTFTWEGALDLGNFTVHTE